MFIFQAYCTDATLILKIKNLIMLFNTTLRASKIYCCFSLVMLTYARLKESRSCLL